MNQDSPDSKYVERDFNFNVLDLIFKLKGPSSLLSLIPDEKRNIQSDSTMKSIIAASDFDSLNDRIRIICDELQKEGIILEQFLETESILSTQERNSISRGRELLKSGAITLSQFNVAYFDELMGEKKLEESLAIRGWL